MNHHRKGQFIQQTRIFKSDEKEHGLKETLNTCTVLYKYEV